MRIKSYYGDTMDAAMLAASRDMGEDALILNTRETPPEFRHAGRFEVVCACADRDAALPPTMVAAPPQSTVAAPPPSMPPPPMKPVPPPPAPIAKTPLGAPATPAVDPLKILLLAGPSGAGKTLTAAKLAIRETTAGNRPVAVATLDSQRVGGIETLRAFCELAAIPFHPFDSPAALLAALPSLQGRGTLVIDTISIRTVDSAATQDIRSLREALSSLDFQLEVHLVLSQIHSASFLEAVIPSCLEIGPTHLLYTHLDEASVPSCDDSRLLSLRTMWCGTGPGVPEDLRSTAEIVASSPPAITAPEYPRLASNSGSLSRYRFQTRSVA
jgi:flagellar biosynthesis GTPase FlhF